MVETGDSLCPQHLFKISLIQSSVDGHLDFVHVLAIVNSAAVKIWSLIKNDFKKRTYKTETDSMISKPNLWLPKGQCKGSGGIA